MDPSVTIDGEQLNSVRSFVYLNRAINTVTLVSKDINRRIQETNVGFCAMIDRLRV